MATQIIRSLQAPPRHKNLAATIGCFDGLHQGHQTLLSNICQQASPSTATAVISFEPHPQKILQPQKPLIKINTIRQQYEQINALKIDYYYLVRFSKQLAAITADDFATQLFEQLKCQYLTVGKGFVFGNGGKGNIQTLQQKAEQYQAIVQTAPLLQQKNGTISSQRIRGLLASGSFSDAAQLLGRPYQISGKIAYGKGLGRQWNYPTCNIPLKNNPPCLGIFAGWATVNGSRYAAAISIGTRPSVNQGQDILAEAHLLDFNQNIYQQRLTIEPVQKIRDEHHFATIDMLKRAIADDIEKTRTILGLAAQ